MNGMPSPTKTMPAVIGTVAVIFLPFLGWLSITLLDIRDRVTRTEAAIPQVYESRTEAFQLRDSRISDLNDRVSRLETRLSPEGSRR